MAKVFFSYRRSDSTKKTKTIYRQFEKSFGIWRFLGAQRRNLFLDKDNIIPKSDFRAQIQRFIIDSDYMLVIIGNTWLAEIQRRQATGATDFVLIEIESAFMHGVTVIPVLIDGAKMPNRDELPIEISQLATQHAHEIHNTDFERDTKKFIQYTRPAMPFHLLSAVIILLTLIGLGVAISDVLSEPNPIPATQVAQVQATTDTPISNDAISENDIRATGAAQAYETLTALAPTSTPTITQTPSNTPISVSDIQQTAQAEIFATETSMSGTQAVIAQATQNAVLIEQFIAGATATYIMQLSLTPPAANTPVPLSETPTTDMPEAERIALEGVATNTEWKNLVGEGGYVREFNGIEMVLVPAGCFTMGNDPYASYINLLRNSAIMVGIPDGEEQCFDNPFWIDKTEVTQADFERLGGEQADPPDFEGANRPVEDVTWFEARDFCVLRSGYLPTEAEWEYAARGPDGLYFPWGNDWVSENVVWNRSSSSGTADVGSILAGASWLGALDMSGNVWERTRSIYADYPYVDTDGREEDRSAERDVRYASRGGGWSNFGIEMIRSAARIPNSPINSTLGLIGFRCIIYQ